MAKLFIGLQPIKYCSDSLVRQSGTLPRSPILRFGCVECGYFDP